MAHRQPFVPRQGLRRSAVLLMAVLFPVTAGLAQVRLTEFMAANASTLADEDGAFEDWIEIQNVSTTNVNLLDWCLTDNATNLTQWRFPATNLPPNGFLVVFASNKNRHTPGQPLHSNFKLAAGGEYLALVLPDGVTKATEFTPKFAGQISDVSFGFGVEKTNFTLVATNALARVRIPTVADQDLLWTLPGFNDATWRAGTNGVGYDTSALNPAEDGLAAYVTDSAPLGWWRFNQASGAVATNSGSLGVAANGTYGGGFTLNQTEPRPPTFKGFESNNVSVLFNGTSAYVQLTNNGAFAFSTGPYSLALWFRPLNAAARGDVFAYSGSANDYFYVETANNSVTLVRKVSSAGNGLLGTASGVVNNQWNHLVITRNDSSKLEVWLNGALKFITSDGNSLGFANNLLAGCSGTPGSRANYFNGYIDEVAIYDRELSTNEITRQYLSATNGTVSYTPFIKTDVRAEMTNVNSSAFVRLPFVVTNVADVARLTLRMRYDDGFVAYVNGNEALSVNAPEEPDWNSSATARNQDLAAVQWQEFDISEARGSLVAGTNLLAIHGLNLSPNNEDFLVQAELIGTSLGQYNSSPRYFTIPTPGAPNGSGTADLGPILTSVGFTPAPPLKPLDSDNITVTARVTQAFSPITNVVLRYQVMFGVVNELPMLDDGAHGDGAAGNGIFGAIIPASASSPGQMVRFYISASDSVGRSSRWPLFDDPLNSPEFLGTVVTNAAIASQLPIWEWFAADTVAATNSIGTRGAVWFNGGFYDNVFIRARGGNTSSGSQKFDFNSGDHCKVDDVIGRVEEANLNSNAQDPSYIRPPLAFETYRLGGNPASGSFDVLMRRNSGSDRVGVFVEQVDERFLDRWGFDRNGALYKFVRVVGSGASFPSFYSATDGVEKKTRRDEDHSDLQAFVDAVSNNADPAARRAWFFDNVNLPNFLNHLALRCIIVDTDDVWKNWYWHRDTLGNREWSIFPWDKDWAYGIAGDAGANRLHPFYGDFAHPKASTQWGKLWEFAFNDPVMRPLYLRHLRTMMDQYLGPPGTTNVILQQRAIAWMQPIGAQLGSSVSNQLSTILTSIANRRTELYVTYAATNVSAGVNALVPQATPTNALPVIGQVEYNPASGNQAEEFIQITNATAYALDVSGWKISGAVQFTFRPGTVIPANGALYLSPDVNAFRARAASPHGGQQLFVQGNYAGQLNAWGETLTLSNHLGVLLASNYFGGTPSPAQRYLRVTEIMYNPPPAPAITNDAQQFEYIELKNISTNVTLNLNGVQFTEGIAFDFTGRAVTNLAAGQIVLLVRNQTMFTAKYGGGFTIAGQFSGTLDSSGEKLRLEDAVGEKILEFDYDDAWYPTTDGLGPSLEIINEQAHWSTWDEPASWRASDASGGSPGVTDTDGDGLPDAWESANGTNPNVSDASSDLDGDGLTNFQEYLAGTSPTNAASALRIESPALAGANFIFQFTAVSNRGYTLQFQPQAGASWQKRQDIAGASSNRIVRLTNAVGGSNTFYRIVTPLQP